MIRLSINRLLGKYKGESLMRRQLMFFAPLAATTILVAMTHSLFNAGLARLPAQDIYIAAFAVAKSFMHIFQSAVAMIPQMVTALVKNSVSYHRVRKFVCLDALIITILLGVFTFSGMAEWFMGNVMGLKGEVLKQSVIILGVLVFFPGAVTLRNFYQGITIKFRMTPLVTLATAIRIIYVVIFILIIRWLAQWISAGILAGIMFLGAGIIESLVLYLGTKFTIKHPGVQLDRDSKNEEKDKPQEPFTTNVILRFFLPLVFTSVIATLTGPIINTGLGRTAHPEVIISAFAIALGLGIIVNSPLYLFHQLPLNFAGGNDAGEIQAVKRFGALLGGLSTAFMLIVAFTPAGMFVLTQWIGATPSISLLSLDVLRWMCLLPGLIVVREYYWGILLSRGHTKIIGRGKMVSLAALAVTMLLVSLFPLPNPAVMGVMGMVAAEGAETIYLYYTVSKEHRNKQ